MDIKAFRGLSGTYNVRANERDRGAPRNIECLVRFLNNTQHKFVIDRRSKGQDLLDSVFKYLNLIETDFFGLKYLPQESHCYDSVSNASNSAFNHYENSSASTTNTSASKLCHNTSKLDGTNNFLSKKQSLNSYDQSPSSNASLSSASATNSITNHHSDHFDCATSNSDKGHQNNLTKNAINHNNNQIYSTVIKSNDNLHANINQNHSSSVNTIDENNFSPKFVEERWLDPTKSIRKQYKTGPPYKFYFRVKFYVSDPSKLADDTTRNHLYLQIRQDILNNRLIVPTCSAILLASYILQSEVGDYKRELLEENYASNFRLLPNESDDIKRKVIELHKQHKTLSSADAEYQFLEHAAKKLDCYGVEFHDAKDTDKNNVRLGVSSNGIVVFKDNVKMDQFSWAKIIKIMFKKKLFSIQLRRDESHACDNLISFNLLTNQACKSFWEECVAQHSFFRLHQPKTTPKKFFSFLNFGSKFQYNGKTEYQTMEESRKRSFSHFSRSPSKRYARRTIPIGRPSWSDNNQQDAKDNSSPDGNNHESNADYIVDRVTSAPLKFDDVKPSSIVSFRSTPSSLSGSKESHDPSYDKATSSAYRPKSLTLKSFMYIDETRSIAAQDQGNQVSKLSNPIYQNCSDVGDSTDIVRLRKELKRSESLRISIPLKGVLSLTKISESIRDRFSGGRSKSKAKSSDLPPRIDKLLQGLHEQDLENGSELKIVKLSPGKDGKYGFKIRKLPIAKKSDEYGIIVYDVSPNSPAANGDPRLYEGDRLLTINGMCLEDFSEANVENLIRSIQQQKSEKLVLEVNSCFNVEHISPSSSHSDLELSPKHDLAESIRKIKESIASGSLSKDFEKLARRKEDESLDESRLMENIDKNRYQDILPYDSTRVQLIDSMTGDYINASFVHMPVPSGKVNRYIATQGPLASTCDDFWQMVWEQNCPLIIMVTPLIEGGRVKCHKYWPDEKDEVRYGQILVRNLSEKSKSATIDRTIQLIDVKSGDKRTVVQIQYKAWPDHEVPEDCNDFLKLVNRVRKFRASSPTDPIVVHCSAGIGRTGVLILMETALCIMESGEPIYPLGVLEEMRKQRAMLIQTDSQFLFVSAAICEVYDQELYKGSKNRKK